MALEVNTLCPRYK